MGRTWLAIAALLLLCFAFNFSYLGRGFFGDDILFLTLLEREPLPFSRWLGMWSTTDLDSLRSLWWFSGAGEMSGFWRPLPSLVFEGSVRLLGATALPLHLCSLLLHGAVAGALYLLVMRLDGRPATALLAAVFFLACEDHSMGVGWIATMPDLFCALFALLAFLAHLRWLTTRRGLALGASLVALTLALLSKESAVAVPPAMVLLSVYFPRGSSVGGHGAEAPALRVRLAALARDPLSWLPAIALGAGYLVLYRALGFGNLNTGLYVDPLAQPLRFLGHLVVHMPVLWLASLSPVPPSLTWFLPQTLPLLAVAGLIAFALWIAALWPLRASPLVRWSLALYLLALLPQLGSDASERALYFPMVGASIPLALLVLAIPIIGKRLDPRAARPPPVTRVGGWIALFVVLVPGVVLSASLPFSYGPSFERLERQVESALPHIEAREPEVVYLLNTPGCFHTFYAPGILEYRLERPPQIHVLSSMNAVTSLERLDGTDFRILADRPGWLGNPFASIFRGPGALEPGSVFRSESLQATLEQLTADRADVLAVRFHVERGLGDPALLFLQWNGEAFQPLELDALPPGERLVLADTSDLSASL